MKRICIKQKKYVDVEMAKIFSPLIFFIFKTLWNEKLDRSQSFFYFCLRKSHSQAGLANEKYESLEYSLAIKFYLKITQICRGLNVLLSCVDLREHRYEANHNTLQCEEKLKKFKEFKIIWNTAAQAKRIMANVLTKVVLPWYSSGSW